MSFLNLSLGELLGLVGAISAAVVALYLLDRSKRKQVVATLRFWVSADVRTQLQHRRKIQQPWSLLLELISLMLLLAAIAGPQLGVIDAPGRDHVLILDTSAWMGSRAQRGTLMDEARESALAYLNALPSRDRVMLVRADALATPATAFESNRQALEQAIAETQPGSSALNLEQALQYAQQAQRLQSQRAGEIAFVGAGRVREDQAGLEPLPPNLRVITVGAPQENVGLRKIGLRRSPSESDVWQIFVAVRNYGVRPHDVDLGLQFSQSPAGQRRMHLAPGAEQQETFLYRTKVAGWLEARLRMLDSSQSDAFPQDDRALIEVPAEASVHVVVYSDEPQLLRPLIAADPLVDAAFEPVSKYDAAVKADLVVLDRFAPRTEPATNSLWIEPPVQGSPVGVREANKNLRLESWSADSELGAGIRTQDVLTGSAESFAPAPGDITVAESTAGPVIVAREDKREDKQGSKLVVLGFHPGRGPMKYQLATPLLMANILRWVAPGTFLRREVQAGTVGTVTMPVEEGADPTRVRVVDENRHGLPFTIEGKTLQFFAGAPGTVRVIMGDRETDYSLTLPDVAEASWKPPASVRHGVPRAAVEASATQDLWPWLAALGGLGLLIDWLLFGRSRLFRLRPSRMAVPLSSQHSDQRKAS